MPGHWKSKVVKQVRKFAGKHPRLSKWARTGAIYLIAILAGSVVFYFSNGDDRQTLTTAAQSMIQLAAFLAAASGVLTAIYLGQVLKGIPENVEKTVPPLMTTVNRAITEAASRATDHESQVRLTRDAMNTAFKDWHDAVMGSMSGAKRIRSGGSHPLYLLVASAISAVSVILSGLTLLLGLSVSLMVLATWAIFRSWKIAEESMQGVIGTSSFFGGVHREEIRIVHPDPEPVTETNVTEANDSSNTPSNTLASRPSKFRYQYFLIVILVESILVDWLLFYRFSDFTRLAVISAVTGMFIVVEGILMGLSPMIKVPFMRDIAVVLGIAALLVSVAAFSVATYNTIQFGSLSANSITYYYWDPAWVLFLVFVEWYGAAIIVPFAPDVKEQVQQIKKSP